MYLRDFVVTLNDYSPDSVDPRLLNFHLHSGLSDPAVFPEEEVPQAVAVDWHIRMNVDIPRSRDLDLSALLERIPCSADDCGFVDDDEESTIVKSSSDI